MNPSSTPSKSTAGASDPERFLDDVETAVTRLHASHPEWFPCRPGCADCCHRPFAITELDAIRLRQGLENTGPEAARAITQRAVAAWTRLQVHFPGDVQTARLTENQEWREWFFNRTAGHPCPVLDPATQTCLLYQWRPAACRLYGPLLRIEDAETTPCPLCYQGAGPEQIRATLVTIALPPQAQGDAPQTLIAPALCGTPRGAGPWPAAGLIGRPTPNEEPA